MDFDKLLKQASVKQKVAEKKVSKSRSRRVGRRKKIYHIGGGGGLIMHGDQLVDPLSSCEGRLRQTWDQQ